MAFATMHFATGMACGGLIGITGVSIFRRGLRFVPLAMTAGGLWAMAPDMTRLFTEDFPNAPFASILGSQGLKAWLESHANWFAFHGLLDDQPKELALHGMFGIVVMYNLAILMLMLTRRRRDCFEVPRHVSASLESASKVASDNTPGNAPGDAIAADSEAPVLAKIGRREPTGS